MKSIKLFLIAFIAIMSFQNSYSQVSLTATAGTTTGSYTTIKAAFDAINLGTHQGVIVITLSGSTTESATAVLYQSGYGSVSSYTSVNIYPTSSGLSVSGSLTAPLIDLNGADNVTIDGRVNASGTDKDLVISNTSTSSTAGTSTIRFINDATSNTVKYCTISGSETVTTSGVIFISTGTTTGNDNNTIDNNTVTAAGANLPYNAIYSSGTTTGVTYYNSGISITNNFIQDYFAAGSTSIGLNCDYSTGWTITGNRFFQTGTRTSTAGNTHYAVKINSASGSGFTINNNIIGYGSSAGTGTTAYAGAFANRFMPIQISVASSPASDIQGNTITAISITTTSGATTAPGIFTGISILSGGVNVGTTSANIIGASTGTGAITLSSTTTPYAAGIYSTSTGTVSIQNNIIGGISATGSTASIAMYFHGINTAGTAGNYTISGNTIGSSSTSNSITVGTNGTTTAACTFNGITQTATGTISVSGNTIKNCTMYGSGASVYTGIINSGGTGTVSINSNSLLNASLSGTGDFVSISNTVAVTTLNIYSNTISGITSTSTGNIYGISNITSGSTTVNLYSNSINTISSSGASSNMHGIYSTVGTTVNIYSNTINGLSGTGTTTPVVNGINIAGGTTVNAYKNNIFNLSENGSGITGTGALNGILMGAGTTVNTYNNFISELKASASSSTDIIRGISVTSATSSTTYRVYNNTVYLNASTSGTNFGTSGIYHTASTTSTTAALDLRNNIIANNSTPKGTGYTVAFRRSAGTASYLANYYSTSPYSNNNLFYAGTPGASNLIYYDGTSSAQTITQYKAGVFTAGTISPRDANSVSELPPFVNVSSSPYDLSISTGSQTLCEGRGSVISTPSITADYFNNARYPNIGYPVNLSYPPSAPDIGAHEFGGIPFGLSGTIYVGSGQTYTSLTNANGLFDFINNYGITGNLTALITSDLSSESGTISLNQWSGSATLTISPNGGAARTISGTYDGSLITLNGADNVTFNGLNTGGNSLIITNTSTGTSASTIKLINDASGNTITNCTVKGASINTTTGGVVWFSTGTTTGNLTNTVSNCNITKDAAGTPAYLLYSNGTSAKENTATISNNNFYDFGTMAVWCAGNSKNWTINGNSIYQTGTVSSVVNMELIRVQGDGYSIYGNYLGGSTANCGGTAFTMNCSGASSLNGITVYGATNPATSIYSNTISNISITNVSTSNSFTGIYAYNGDVNIGTNGGNTIGSTTGNGSITVNSNYSGGSAYTCGIWIPTATTGTKTISNNNIGSINVGNSYTTSNSGHKFYGILAYAGTISITNNVIGSTTTSNSINATNSQSAGATSDNQFVQGIHCETTGSVVITGNTIANMNNSWLASTSSMAGCNYGMYVYNPSSENVSNNTIYSISTAQPMYYSSNNYYSITGMYLNSISSTTASTVSGNIIYDLRNTSSTQATRVTGIYYYGNSSGTSNKVENNFIHSLYTASNTSVQYGMVVGNGYAVFRNNLIRLGIDKDGNSVTASAQTTGIYSLASSGSTAFNSNTIYIGGTGVAAGSVKTYAFYKSNSATDTVRNNIFVNVRQNAVTVKQHYATYYAGIPSVSDYNIFYYSAADGQIDNSYSTMQTFRVYQVAKVNDLHSAIGDPKLVNPTGSVSSINMNISTSSGSTPVEGTGLSSPNVALDYSGQTRSGLSPTDMGAHAGDFVSESSSDDIFTPVITYTTFTNFGISNVTLTNFATITDQISGVNTNAGTKPRLYYKKSTDANAFVGNTSANNGWKYVEATNDASPFSFVIDHSILNGGVPSSGTTIQYYVVAQDLASTPNVLFWPLAGSVGTSVGTTGMTAPTTLNSYTIPSAPTATAATNRTSSGFRANWTAFTGATGYYLDVATDINFTSFVTGYQNLDVGNVTYKDVTGLNNNTHFYYRFRAYNSTGTTGSSNIINAATLHGTAPTTQATSLTFSDYTGVGYRVSFTRGNGDRCAVFAKASLVDSPSPVDGTCYTANASFGSGTQIGSTGWYCVYKGTGSFVTISGMSVGTTYRIKVLEYNGNDSCEAFNITDATGNPADQSTTNTALSGTKYIMATGGDYTTFTNAVTALNNRGVGTGGVTFIFGDASYPNETYPVTINQITGASSTSTITFKPDAGITTTLSGSYNGALINYNGADYVTFNGDNSAMTRGTKDSKKGNNKVNTETVVNAKDNKVRQEIHGNNTDNVKINGGSTGTSPYSAVKNLIITNTNTGSSASTIKLYNDASYNTFMNCTLKGANTNSSGGVLFFGTATTAGNINDTVKFCDIRNDDAGKPLNLIFSDGTSTKENSNIIITDNNLYNFGIAGSSAIRIISNSNTWSITNNNVFQTDPYTGAAGTMYGFYIGAGNGHTISANYIGGSSANCGGTAWTVSGTAAAHGFTGMYLNVGTTTATSVQGNTIQNFNWTSLAATWTGITIAAGLNNIGNVTGNIIGADTGNGSITYLPQASSCNVYGISNASTSSTNISNNKIGSFTASPAAYGIAFYGIYSSCSATSGSVYTIENNLIGSLSTANSIYLNTGASGTVSQGLVGISFSGNTTSFTMYMRGNTIANLNNNSTSSNASVYCVSLGSAGNGTVSGNTIRDITSNTTNPYTNGSPHVGFWIANSSYGSGLTLNVTQNTIYNMYNTNNSSHQAYVSGIFISAGYTNLNITCNRIYNLNNASTNASCEVHGIKEHYTYNSPKYINNQISLGKNSTGPATIYGIDFYNLYSSTQYVYYNSIYITGSGSGASYAFLRYSDQTTYVKNNILYNDRSGGTAYAIASTNNPPYTGFSSGNSNYNLLVVPNASYMGYWWYTSYSFADWKTTTGLDANSWNMLSSGITAANLFTDPDNGNLNINTANQECWYVKGKGIPLTGYADDFSSTNVRSVAVSSGTTDIGSNVITTTATNPYNATVSGSHTNGGTETFTFAGRTIAAITWGATGTLPTVNYIRYHISRNPGNPTGNYSNAYWEVNAAGGSGYTYSVTYYYDPNMIYKIGTESNIRLAKSEDNSTWVAITSTVNTTSKTVTATGLTSFSYFALSDINYPLPVSLSSLNSVLNGRNVTINWITSQEQNNAGFEIQRCIGNDTLNQVWEKAGYVEGAGTKNIPTVYRFEDTKLKSGKYRYRLKQKDFNGNIEYFNVEGIIEVGIPSKFDMSQNYPNPFNPVTKIDYQLAKDSRVSLIVYDMTGREMAVLINNEFRQANYYTVSFDARNLSSGVYFYRIISDNSVITKKMTLVK